MLFRWPLNYTLLYYFLFIFVCNCLFNRPLFYLVSNKNSNKLPHHSFYLINQISNQLSHIPTNHLPLTTLNHLPLTNLNHPTTHNPPTTHPPTTHQQQECEYDQLTISSMVGENEVPHGSFCGADLPHPITSDANIMKIVFASDNTVEKDGFNATYFLGWVWLFFCVTLMLFWVYFYSFF